VGAYRLFIKCSGEAREGTPVVVLDAGHGDTSDTWDPVQPEVARFARVCSYDRAGTGKSDAAPKPRTSEDIVRDLHALLANAGIKPPYVLVGHSFGGLNARLYASRYPEEVVGMVLVDSSHEDQDDRALALMPPEVLKQAKPEDMVVPSPEGVDFKKSFAQVRAADWHSDIPLIVLTQGRRFNPEDYRVPSLAPKFQQLHMELQRDLARRSSRGRQIVAEKSGHYIQRDQPELVVDAIRQVVEEARTR
jgi:pimeloyl-ACP methyl ester carboxylesterase